MRIRNVKNKEVKLNSCEKLIKNPKDYCGKWITLFNNNNPIYIEIGMGKGKFIIENAKRYPNINFIGIERLDNIVVRAIEKLDEDLPNLLFIRMNALEIDEVFNKEISRIYLNFSDPWPKLRHHFRRLTSEIYLDKYDKIFTNSKEIHLKTDNEDLFSYSLETLSKHNYYFDEVLLNVHKKEIQNWITTEYEERFKLENKPIFFLKAVAHHVQNSKK